MHENLVKLLHEQVHAAAEAVQQRNITKIYTVACGGSLATLFPVEYILGRETTKVSVHGMNASEFAYDMPKEIDEHTLVILNSQSGKTGETVLAAQEASKKGAMTISYTTAIGSPIEEASDMVIYYYDNPANPYPLLLSIYPEVYLLTAALLDAIEGKETYSAMKTAMENLEEVNKREVEKKHDEAVEFGNTHGFDPIIYTCSAGLEKCIAYILTNCSFMESVWKHSSPLNAGELFHGACEAIDSLTPVVVFLGLGGTRKLEERALNFLRQLTPRLTILDAKELDLTGIPEELHEYVAPLVLHALASDYCLKLSEVLNHPMDSRRYMGILKY